MPREPFEERFIKFMQAHPHAPENASHFPDMLRAAFPGATRQTGAMLVAWKAGILDEIDSQGTVSDTFATGFARRISNVRHLAPDLAEWAVRLWITACGSPQNVSQNGSKVTSTLIPGRADIRYRSSMGGKIVDGCNPPIPAVLVVPDRHEDMPVRSIAVRAFRESIVRVVVLGANVKAIEDEAFADCLELVQAVLPDGLEEIGREAFAYCERLKAAKLPPAMKRIGRAAFAGTALTEAAVPNSVRSLESAVFENCSALLQVDVGLGIEELPERMFAGCSSLESVDLPASLERISGGAFADCRSLKRIRIPDAVKFIARGAFEGTASDLVLIGRRRSAAQYYAKEHGVGFQEFF